jgi:hypothetical protein
VKKITNASQRAAHDTARFMTSQLRNHARNAGWEEDVINNMSVVYEDKKFSTRIHPDYQERAFVHEYGDLNNRPKATIRKYANDPQAAKTAFTMAMGNHWKGF